MKTLLTQEVEDRDPQTPIAILDLAAYGRASGQDFDVGYHEELPDLEKYNCVWFSVLTLGDRAIKSLESLRNRYHGYVVVGGKATTALTDGERSRLQGLGIDIHEGPGEELIAPLPIDYDSYPAWNPKDFRALDKFGRMDMMMTSRGCPYHCHFCHNTEPKVSYFSPSRTVANAILLLEVVKRPRAFFVDDIFALNPKRMMAILDEADRNKLQLRKRTSFFVHISQVDDARLEAIDAFQPQELQVGIESGDDRMLQAMGKTCASAEAEEKLRLLHSHGQRVACLFLMGFPGETRDSLQATVDFATRNRAYMSGWWVSYFQPVPGTKGWAMAKERDSNFADPGWNTEITYLDPNLTRNDLEEARKGVMG